MFLLLSLLLQAKEPAGHWRLETAEGPVHVYRPAGYEKKKAGVVVYVHGLYNNVDSAWDQHDLPAQFQESNRNAIFMGGLRPHYYCLPVLKREVHRQALVGAATSGSAKFFLGTDSAPHAAALKEASVCGAGCYTAPAALELYAEAFEGAGALDRLEPFASFNGPDFYGLPRNRDTVTLRRQPWQLPESVPFGDAQLKPLRGGETLNWRLEA